ncbi:ROK family protein [Alteribacter populi]|uniref:ROK family protein n=1 Tax=Alteribacter populi TaxID=2011011 RepID=UPI0012FFC86F|nr:ROK family protein [Alteribacter populi]
MSVLLTVDIGGTYTKLALVSNNLQLLEESQVDTPATFQQLVQALTHYYKQTVTNYQIKGIAISSPGSVKDTGEVLGYSSVPFLHEQNIKVGIEKRYDLPVSIENDANCAALAEKWNGAACDVETYACIVVGTGVGGAIVINNQLHKGANLHGGEFGYAIMSSERQENTYDTWSIVGSSSAITRRLKEEPPFFDGWTGELAFEYAKKDHAEAKKTIDEFFHSLAVGVFNIQYMIDPEKILIGGGVTRQPGFMDQLHRQLDRIYENLSFASIHPNVQLCRHLDKAQLLGAAYVWKEKYGKW